jgi:hypothetical protein
MIGRFLCMMAFAAAAYSQVQVFTFDGTAEHAMAGVTDLGSTAILDFSETRFRARNNGVAAVSLQTLSLSGQAFSISAKPSLPYIIAPGNFVEFRVRFAPAGAGSYSATLAVNGAQFFLRATCIAAPVLSVQNEAIGTLLDSSSAIDFGRVLKNRSATKQLRMANSSTVPLTVSTLRVIGSAFHGASDVTLPLQLAPGAAVTFSVSFDPKTSGQQSGSLQVDARAFAITGTGYDPPLPTPSIAINGPAASAAQPALSVKLADVSEVAGNGTITLDFQPATPGTPDDPAIMFLATGSRRMSFQVAEGDSAASFGTPSVKQIAFQTGTTAGKITFTIQLGDYTGTTVMTIAPAPVALDSARASLRVSDLDVQITAFDNTRTGGKFNFTFYDRSGKTVGAGAIPVDVSSDFGRYFAISKVGGAFLMRATFPVTGDATQIGGVEVELINSVGSSRTARLTLQ